MTAEREAGARANGSGGRRERGFRLSEVLQETAAIAGLFILLFFLLVLAVAAGGLSP